MAKTKTAVVIPNWNGKKHLKECLDSLSRQIEPAQIIVVDNGSIDGSAEFIEQNYPDVWLIKNRRNFGFTGGANPGMQLAIDRGFDYVALFNNDAIAEKSWLAQLVGYMERNNDIGIAASKIIDIDKQFLDSTGEFYTIWGLPYSRGRREHLSDKYDRELNIFGASGGASIYRCEMLKKIGLFDQDFFAYYEDVDLSFRAQLAGWKIAYVPTAICYHAIGSTSSAVKGFTTYQSMKNLPFIIVKNVPIALLPKLLPRFFLAYAGFFFGAISRGQFWPAFKAVCVSFLLSPKKIWQRRFIQKNRRVPLDYIKSLIIYDLPPRADRLRKLSSIWHKLT